MKYFKKIEGKKCYLSPLCSDDYPKFTKWLNDQETGMLLGVSTAPISQEKEKEILENFAKSDKIVFAVIDKKNNECIGSCGVHDISYLNRKGTVGILIGNKNYWNKGYGTEAMTLLLDYCFNVLNFHNVMLKVFSYNKRAIRSYEKIGFKMIGKRRESEIIAGKKYDDVMMDILSSEFESPYIKKIMEKIEE